MRANRSGGLAPGVRASAGIVLVLILGRGLAAEEPATYTNPVYPHDFPDPCVVAHEGRYYAYATRMTGVGFQLLESPDLVHWTPRKLEMTVVWAKEDFWAPEVFARGGKFFLTYSALDPQSRKHNLAVATADHPAGPFEHRNFLVLGKGEGPAGGVIDSTIFAEGDGSAFLIYSEEQPRRVLLHPLKPDLLGAAEGESAELIHPDQPWELGVTEAPSLIKRNGVYHLFYSGGAYEGTKDRPGYAVGHATSRTLRGPYTKAPAPLLSTVPDKVYSPGHQFLFKTPDGSWWVAYHAWDAEGQPNYRQNPSGRSLRLDRLEWDGDTPRILGPTSTPQPAPMLTPKPAAP